MVQLERRGAIESKEAVGDVVVGWCCSTGKSDSGVGYSCSIGDVAGMLGVGGVSRLVMRSGDTWELCCGVTGIVSNG